MISAVTPWQFRAMTKRTAAHLIALHVAGDAPPEWLHLLPSMTFKGVDGRGPYQAPDADALIGLFQREGRKLPVDENHAIDLAGKSGHPSPARGWIVELQARADGIWGRVEWTEEGAALVKGKAYGYLSPVFLHTAAKPYRVAKLTRVALTNDPNLDFLTALHHYQEEPDMLAQILKALGLPDTTTEEQALAAVASAHASNQANVALMARIREAAGVAAGTEGEALVTALQSRGKVSPTEAENAELKTMVTSLQSQLTSVVTANARDKAVMAIETAIKDGKVVPALKEHMIARHMKDPQEVETEIRLMPSINAGGLGGRKMPEAGAEALTTEDELVMARWASTPRPMPTRQRRCTERATDMAASNDIRSRRKPGLGRTYGYPVLTGVVLYGGAAIAVTAERNAVPVGHANAVKFVGFAAERVDNSLGATGEQTVTVERDVRLIPLAGAAVANIGANVYATADDTFTLTASTNLLIGVLETIDADGVWLKTL